MIISHSHKLIFVHIHKTAGTSVSVALDPHLDWNDVIVGGSAYGQAVEGPYERRFGLEKHSSARAIRDRIGAGTWQAYTTFSVVREPAARLRSLYTWLETKRRKNRRAYHLSWLRPSLLERAPWTWPEMGIFRSVNGFAEFIRHPDLLSTPGGAPQAEILCDETGRLMVDHVFRTEAVATDLPPFLHAHGIALEGVGHKNPSRGDVRARVELTPDDHALIRELYARDYELFYPEAPRPSVRSLVPRPAVARPVVHEPA